MRHLQISHQHHHCRIVWSMKYCGEWTAGSLIPDYTVSMRLWWNWIDPSSAVLRVWQSFCNHESYSQLKMVCLRHIFSFRGRIWKDAIPLHPNVENFPKACDDATNGNLSAFGWQWHNLLYNLFPLSTCSNMLWYSPTLSNLFIIMVLSY